MSNPNFNPTYSTDQIWRGQNESICLTDDLDAIEADVSTFESGKAPINHGHSYNDLTGKPTIPTTVAQLTDAGDYAKKSEVNIDTATDAEIDAIFTA